MVSNLVAVFHDLIGIQPHRWSQQFKAIKGSCAREEFHRNREEAWQECRKTVAEHHNVPEM
jgi:hypothetical protein